MIIICNLEKKNEGEWTKIYCDIRGIESYKNEFGESFQEEKMWIGVKNQYSNFLASEGYDPFFLFGVYIAMYLGEDLHIKGKISEKLFDNFQRYIKRILLDWKTELKNVNISCEGFVNNKYGGQYIGASISAGIDSLSTIYDRFIMEDNKKRKISHLFYFNCGMNGSYYDKDTYERFIVRSSKMKDAAREIDLPVVEVDTNLHSFSCVLPNGTWTMQHLGIYACILALQKGLNKYYIASTLEYEEYHSLQERNERKKDMGIYAEPYLLPLVRTENIEIELSGSQYTRIEKTELISDWKFAQKYLNVCNIPLTDGRNCCVCEKCFRTMIPLYAFGKLDKFEKVFDLNKFNDNYFKYMCEYVTQYNKSVFAKGIVDYCKINKLKIPNVVLAHIIRFPAHLRLHVAVFIYNKYGRTRFIELKNKIYGRNNLQNGK